MARAMIDSANDCLADQARAALRRWAARRATVTYRVLAGALNLQPPNTIHRLAAALEYTMREDADARQPFIAALVVSRIRDGLPAPGFFDCARRLGRFAGDPTGPDIRAFHVAELEAAMRAWGAHERGNAGHLSDPSPSAPSGTA